MPSPSSGPSRDITDGRGVYPSNTNALHVLADNDTDTDNDESLATRVAQEDDIFDSDPLEAAVPEQRQTYPSLRFPLSTLVNSRPHAAHRDDQPTSPNLRRRHTPTTPIVQEQDRLELPVNDVDSVTDFGDYEHEYKDPVGSDDWYSEGLGRRAGYDDLTAIDWIFEYAKERERLRNLITGAAGAAGQFARLFDASQIWLLLVLTGVGTGLLAASIDIVSDWLGDLKEGVCTSGPGGGRFYLNKTFCCWGWDELSQCRGWVFWSGILRFTAPGSSYFVEYLFFVVFSVLFAGIAAYLVREFATYAKHSGIPEVKTVLGGFVIHRLMTTWTLFIKCLGLCLTVASGLWLGKEGPLVHVACCVANSVLRFFPALNENEARKREVFSAAAAAGISVAFGAPIGGVLFSLEQLSFYFPDKTMWQSFVCAMVAAFTLQVINPFRTGKLVLYQINDLGGWNGFELLPFALLGVIGGLCGALFIKINMAIAQWRKQKSPALLRNPIAEVVVVAIITGLINFPNRFMRVQFPELVATLFAECSDLRDERLGLCGAVPAPVAAFNLMAAAVLGFCLTTITFGLQIPAGIILPSMAIGALYGRMVGLLLRTWQLAYPNFFLFSGCPPDVPCVVAGNYAIIGAASALGGVTRMTISIVVIMFELTGALSYVLPLMITVMISKWVGDAFGKHGIYESWIFFNGYPFLDNRDDAAVPDVSVANIMTRFEDLVIITATGHTLQSLDRLLKAHTFRGFPIVEDKRDAVLLGYISRVELAYAIHSALHAPRPLPPTAEAYFSHQPLADPETMLDLRPWMDQTPICLNAKSTLQLAADMFLKLGLRYVLFCEKGILKGLLTKKDVWFVLNDADGRKGMVGTGGGVLREEQGGEERGLLGRGLGGEDEADAEDHR